MTTVDHARLRTEAGRRLDQAAAEAHALADDIDAWLTGLDQAATKARTLAGR